MCRPTGTFGFRWPADTETDTEEILSAKRVNNILDAIVAGRSRGECRFACSGRDIEIIVQYDDILRSELVEIQKRADGATGTIHEGSRFDEEIFLFADSADGKLGVETGFPMEIFEIEMFAEIIKREEAGVVSGRFVLFSGIAEADDEFHS